jgi:transposase InsO family protein
MPRSGQGKESGQATGRSAPAPSRVGGISTEQRLLLLDTWRRSGLPAGDFAALVGMSKHTLYAWKQRFEKYGPMGLMDRPRAAQQKCRLPEATKRAILMLKEAHPEWGCQRITDVLARGPALAASLSAVARVLHEAGYVTAAVPTRPHPDHPRRFERARPNQLWQTDLFTFMLKRQNRRVYLVAFMDDHSRFIVAYGLHASQSTALVLEVLEAGLANYGAPEEILTDNGAQYVTWRGKSQFTKQLEKRGIRQIVAHPRRPQTLGKIERFWGTLWRECLETAIFLDLEDARRRIGLFLDYYNFFRPHQGLDGTGQVPADRYFQAAPDVLRTLKARVSANALELARHGVPKQPFYLTGQFEGEPFSVHRAGERLILSRAGQASQEIELAGGPTADTVGPAAAGDDEATSYSRGLPLPVCPDGSPLAEAGEPATRPPLEPGRSGLEAYLSAEVGAPRDTDASDQQRATGGEA